MGGERDYDLPPSVIAAQRTTRPAAGGSPRPDRAYAVRDVEDDPESTSAQLAATRALLTATTPHEVAAVISTLVHDLGGGLVPARLTGTQTPLPLDVSLGLSEPMLPWADPVSVASMRLARILPEFVEDARGVVARLAGEIRMADEADRDVLTGLLTRRAWMRRLSAAREGDAVALLDLDMFKAVNDTAGHAAGDEVLRAIGRLLVTSLRTVDACGRYGGDELACLAPGMPAEALARRADELRAQWRQERPPQAATVGLSIGVATIGADGPRAALHAADRALYRVKQTGRDATAIAAPDDDTTTSCP